LEVSVKGSMPKNRREDPRLPIRDRQNPARKRGEQVRSFEKKKPGLRPKEFLRRGPEKEYTKFAGEGHAEKAKTSRDILHLGKRGGNGVSEKLGRRKDQKPMEVHGKQERIGNQEGRLQGAC